MITRPSAAVRTRAVRASVFKVQASSALRSAPKKKGPPPLVKVKPVHKSVVQVMPKRSVTVMSTSKKGPMNAAAGTSRRSNVQTVKPSIRSAVKPRIAPKKLKIIKPAKKPLGWHSELTSRSLRKLMGYMCKFGMIYEELAGASDGITPTMILRGGAAGMSVPVDRDMEEKVNSTKLLVSGIPSWLDETKVYYDLLVYLAKHHLVLTNIEFTSHATDDRAAWVTVTLDYEAELMLEAAGYQLKFPVHQVFSIPESIRVNPDMLLVSMVENATALKPQIDRFIMNPLPSSAVDKLKAQVKMPEQISP